MEDIVKFLLVIGFIIVGIAKQYKKETNKEAESDMPLPDAPDEPLPDLQKGDTTYGGYIPEGPQPVQPIVQPVPKPRKKKGKAKPFLQTSEPSLHSTPAAPPLVEPQAPEEPSEFSIRSAEEARKAIIWSEILNRKHF